MVNVNKLKGKIVECGISVSKLAKEIGVDKSTLYRKLQNDGESITIKEATLIISALSLTVDEAHSIFFHQFVA